MTDYIDLKKLERKAFTSIFQDGFLDIYLGILFIGIGLLSSLSETIPIPLYYGLFTLIIGIGLLIFLVGKKFITVPRIGIIKFSKKRKVEKKKFVLIIIILIIMTGIIYLLSINNLIPFESYLSALIFGLIFALTLSLLANFLRIDRYYVYALLGGISFFISELSYSLASNRILGYFAIFITGSVFIITGIVILIKFLRKYPVQDVEVK